MVFRHCHSLGIMDDEEEEEDIMNAMNAMPFVFSCCTAFCGTHVVKPLLFTSYKLSLTG